MTTPGTTGTTGPTGTPGRSGIDPIKFEVIRNALTQATDPLITADAMVDVHHRIPDRQVAKIGTEHGGAMTPSPGRRPPALTENIPLAEDGQRRVIQLESM